MEVGLGPSRIVLDGDPTPQRGHSPQFWAHVCCVQTTGWINMPLGTEVGLGPRDIVRWGPTSPTPQKRSAAPPSLFGSCIVANGPKCQRSEGSLVRKLLLLQCVGTTTVQWVTLTWWTLAQRQCTRSPTSENLARLKFEGWEREEQGRDETEKEISVQVRRHEEGERVWSGEERGQGKRTEEGKVRAKGRRTERVREGEDEAGRPSRWALSGPHS